ncbi:DUF3862 domain-containing protein [Exiguobacterium sp. SH5S4]|uniref:DUF3862 domain-containing protein n=1 Tax=Exiguobacterium sp. SH5S4 TaxID=2510961 RepID=UPI00103DEB55|nr:DUF3862 domain-containing protein [Exiguobacterium sp. SH5S4]TCI25534.1 DUF3862 domain-containing protein [Exiguobacterium sp. SH5S4]
MKTIFKIVVGILIAVTLLGVGAVACTGAFVNEVDKELTKTTEEAKTDTSKPGLAEYEKVQTGMTIEEVNAILGEPTDNTVSESDGFKMEMVSYDARGDLGANILVTFENGAMSTKTQTGVAE